MKQIYNIEAKDYVSNEINGLLSGALNSSLYVREHVNTKSSLPDFEFL